MNIHELNLKIEQVSKKEWLCQEGKYIFDYYLTNKNNDIRKKSFEVLIDVLKKLQTINNKDEDVNYFLNHQESLKNFNTLSADKKIGLKNRAQECYDAIPNRIVSTACGRNSVDILKKYAFRQWLKNCDQDEPKSFSEILIDSMEYGHLVSRSQENVELEPDILEILKNKELLLGHKK